jgi:hypothetical protein
LLTFGWVHRAAGILGAEGVGGQAVRQRLSGLLGAMARQRTRAGALADQGGDVQPELVSGQRQCAFGLRPVGVLVGRAGGVMAAADGQVEPGDAGQSVKRGGAWATLFAAAPGR